MPTRQRIKDADKTVESGPVVFEAQVPGETWWGLFVSESARFDKSQELTLRDAVYNRAVSTAELDAQGFNRPTAVFEDEVETEEEAVFALWPNYPNPFGWQTALRYGLAEPSQARLHDLQCPGSARAPPGRRAPAARRAGSGVGRPG